MNDEPRCKNCTRSLLELERYIKVPVPPDLSEIKYFPAGSDFEHPPPPKVDAYCLKCWYALHPDAAPQ